MPVRGIGHHGGAEHAAGPRFVLDDDRRSQHRAQLVSDHSRQKVDGTAGLGRNNDADRFRRPGMGRREREAEKQRKQQKRF